MTPPLRFVFDDCLSKHAVNALKALAEFTDGQVEFAHLVDFAISQRPDRDWIPQIPKEKWVVITTDRGKKNHGGKLPLLCQRNGVSYVLLSAAIHARNTFDKIRALFAVWPDLANAATDPKGHGYMLRVKNAGKGVQLDCIFMPPDQMDVPKIQQDLGFKW